MEVLNCNIEDIANALDQGFVSSVSLVEGYLARIERDDVEGKGLNAIISVAPREKVLKVARQLDDERKEKGSRGALHGLPILVKDSINTDPKMGMPTTSGSHVLKNATVPGNAAVIDQLVNTGCIILGKINLTHLSSFCSITAPNGWSPVRGQCKNPRIPESGRDVGGSGTGSAAGVAAGFAVTAIGTEAHGSIMTPSGRMGLYGIKCGSGLIPFEGIMNTTEGDDCLGVFAKSVRDLAIMVTAMVKTPFDYVPPLNTPRSPTTVRLGVLRKDLTPWNRTTKEEYKERLDAFDDALTKLRESGVELVDPVDIQDIEDLWLGKREFKCADGSFWEGTDQGYVIAVEGYGTINRYLGSLKSCEVRDVEGLIRWNDEYLDLAFHPENTAREQTWLRLAVSLRGAKDEQYHRAKANLAAHAQTVRDVMSGHRLHGLVVPSASPGAIVAECGGFPIGAIPISVLSCGEPVGMMTIGSKGREAALLEVMLEGLRDDVIEDPYFGLRRKEARLIFTP